MAGFLAFMQNNYRKCSCIALAQFTEELSTQHQAIHGPTICACNIHVFPNFWKRKFQEVLFDRTPSNVLGWATDRAKDYWIDLIVRPGTRAVDRRCLFPNRD